MPEPVIEHDPDPVLSATNPHSLAQKNTYFAFICFISSVSSILLLMQS